MGGHTVWPSVQVLTSRFPHVMIRVRIGPTLSPGRKTGKASGRVDQLVGQLVFLKEKKSLFLSFKKMDWPTNWSTTVFLRGML